MNGGTGDYFWEQQYVPAQPVKMTGMSTNGLGSFLEGPATATQAGISQDDRRRFIQAGHLEPVVRRGEPVMVRTGSRGRPAGLLKLTRKGRRLAQSAA